MADNYLQFSEEIENTTKEERAWLDSIMQLAEYDLEAPSPPNLLDLSDRECDDLSWAFTMSHDAEGTSFYAEENGNVDLLGKILHAFLVKFRPEVKFTLTWADTCSKLRIGQFSGGALVVDKTGWCVVGAYDIARLSVQELKARFPDNEYSED